VLLGEVIAAERLDDDEHRMSLVIRLGLGVEVTS
jgi:hypothetical protein